MEVRAIRYLVAYFQVIHVKKQMEKTSDVFRISSFIGLIVPTKIGGFVQLGDADFSRLNGIIDER